MTRVRPQHGIGQRGQRVPGRQRLLQIDVALRDVDLGGVHITKGQRVGMFYGSTNYGEEVFDELSTFGIARSPNPHLGFGARGAHYCGAATRSALPWINGTECLPVDYGPTTDGGARPS